MHNKKLKLLTILGGIAISSGTNAQVYMCKQCPAGTYVPLGGKSCLECPANSVCPAGSSTPIPIANCTKLQIGSFASGSGTKDIFAGTYFVEVAGGGGGGGGSRAECFGFLCAKCRWGNGGRGGRGDRIQKVVYVDSDIKYTYSVGGGGKGGCADCGGGTGGTSTFKLSNGSLTISAQGGGGGPEAPSTHTDGATGYTPGTGLGGTGGSGGGKKKPCKDEGGNGGAAGWVTVYQLGNCHL